MFIHKINPILLDLGILKVRYYGLVYALGFIIAYFVLKYAIKKNYIKNLTYEKLDELILYLIIGTIVGGRLGEVIFFNPKFYFTHPLEIIKIWNGGMAFHGALIALVIITYFYCKKNKINFFEIADVLSVPALITLGLGRIANFINHELIGKPNNAWWCIDYSYYGIKKCRYPSQIFEAIKNFTIGIILFLKYNIKPRKGIIFAYFLIYYNLFRFLIDFYRDDPVLILGISTGQTLSVLGLIAGIILLTHKKTSNEQHQALKTK